MSRVSNMVAEFVATFPTTLRPGVLYVSGAYSTAAHLCCCGCGHEVITPLSRAQWVLTFDGTVSLRPSIGNWTLPCRSHYFIDSGSIRWARRYSEPEIEANREHDRQLLADARIDTPGGRHPLIQYCRSVWRRLRRL
ncbi:hypothetical protein GCM10009679_32870 [Saccharothrix algeriensis]|uniref:Uncharacterized protein n=2 Tax=Catellatospora bangladeshensis TaxID=310355 RepID=A0A8J3NGZ2_9ACTN|nr:hypothetical protein Cba03nite_22090 [Catellatospora bangladeshensis]